jgi:hypothetical protein
MALERTSARHEGRILKEYGAGRSRSARTLDDRMDILALLAAVLDIGDLLSTRRVTVKDRYEMKKRVRERRRREREAARRAAGSDRLEK